MPYPRAAYAVLACIAVIVVGFWASYLSVYASVPWQFHAHGVAASLWVLMVLAQSITPHARMMGLHRATGKASLLLFPFLIGGLFAIIDYTGKNFVAGDGPVRQMFGGEFLIGLAIAALAYLVLYHEALRHRARVWDHAGYMLATPLILFESPLSRIFAAWVPGLVVTGPDSFDRIISSIVWAMAVELAIVAYLWWRVSTRRARPFLVAGLFIVAQMLAMGLMHHVGWLERTLVWIGGVPSAAVVLSGMALGAGAAWSGWVAGRRPARRTAFAA
ncbi:hypothetical protein [Sphingomonas astaxanthinifaciens]|uniref:Uncharacterized protein n=1 Tax=Sphingomonas astaxanthinifaciens DSM 22298 TaxID=1123267 RepID=A0ABQ5Z379_9SPHN|nr:hypothetical protein [Sphingomonas astaxanthinifaciens]GLR46532.1 hypothetical protein GCM10007925_02430 [Sphingomonas astaxanthinifaciens DSM 22298]